MRKKLTKRVLDALPLSEERDAWVWDTLTGFAARKAKRTGRISFVVQYRPMRGGPNRRVTLGEYGPCTVDQARDRALKILGALDPVTGVDPVDARRLSSITLAALAKRYIEDYAKPRKKPSSAAEDERLLAKHVVPKLGRRPVSQINRAAIERLHNSMRETPYTANRMLAVVSTMLRKAEEWSVIADGSSPARGVKFFPEQKRKRYLSSAELGRLADALAKEEAEALTRSDRDPVKRSRLSAVAAVRLLIFTGCRRGEILGLRWEHVDLERGMLSLPDSKTGQKDVPLNAPAREILDGLDRHPSGWVFPGRDGTSGLDAMQKPWIAIRKKAGLEDIRLHDLRHSFASVLAGAGVGLYMIGGLLGHTRPETTQRYAHLANDPLQEASELAGAKIKAAMERRPDAEVLRLRDG